MDADDDMFFLEINKRIMLLFNDDEEKSALHVPKPSKPSHYHRTGGVGTELPFTEKSPAETPLLRNWRSKGTGVFFPQEVYKDIASNEKNNLYRKIRERRVET